MTGTEYPIQGVLLGPPRPVDGASQENRPVPADGARAPENGARAAQDGAGLARIARGSTLNLVGTAIMVAGTLGLTVVVTRGFSRSVAGAFFTATSLFLILEEFAVLGADNGLVYFIARLRSLRHESRIQAILRSALVPVVIASIAFAALLIAFAHPFASAMLAGRGTDGISLNAVADALRALAVALPFAALLDTLLGATRGYRDMRPTVAVDRTLRPCLQLLAALVVALLGAAALLAPLWALAYVPSTIAAWILLRRMGRPSAGSAGAPTDQRAQALRDLRAAGALVALTEPHHFWKFTAPRALAMGAQVIIQRLDIVLVGVMRGPVDAAIYTAATRFLVVCQYGNQAITMASQPQLSHLFARRDHSGAEAVYKATTAWFVLLVWPLCLIAILYGSTILSIFGHSYRTGAEVMVILGGAMLFSSACGSVDVVLTSTGRSALSFANGLVALVVNVSVDLALIPTYGITGAAIGWAAAIAASNLIPLIQLHRLERLQPFGKATLGACALTAFSFGAVPALGRVVLGSDPGAEIAAVAVGCAVLAAGLWRWREPLRLSLMPGLRSFRRGFLPALLSQTRSHPETT